MLRIKLAEDDRARLGAPEAIEYDPKRLMALEAIALQKTTGLRPAALGSALQNGDAEAQVALVWLALFRVGIKVKFSELDFDLFGMDIVSDEDDESEDDPGPKAGESTSSESSPTTDGPSPITSESDPGNFAS